MSRKYDIIIFGATGFTGQCLVEKAVELVQNRNESFTWAIAGRSERKLDNTLHKVSQSTGQHALLKKVVKIIANVSDPSSLRDMARQGRIVINCVGPYRFFGEAVVKACLDEGTHHLDVSGEPLFLEKIQLSYYQEAEAKGVYIIGSCGFDSIPGDCGATLLQKEFQKQGDLNSIEMYIDMIQHSGRGRLHYATWQSGIHGVASGHELGPLRRALFTQRAPKPQYPITKRNQLHYSQIVKGWCLHFPGSDKSVITRSQYHFYQKEGITPAQISTYVKVPNLYKGILAIIFGYIFLKLASYKFGRFLLETFPGFFSTGIATHEGPSVADMKALEFKIILKGEGWNRNANEKSAGSDRQKHSGPPNKEMYVRTSFFDPCYGATAVIALVAALTVIRETEKLPSKGGVYSPGAGFSNTQLISKLKWAGIEYTVENS